MMFYLVTNNGDFPVCYVKLPEGTPMTCPHRSLRVTSPLLHPQQQTEPYRANGCKWRMNGIGSKLKTWWTTDFFSLFFSINHPILGGLQVCFFTNQNMSYMFQVLGSPPPHPWSWYPSNSSIVQSPLPLWGGVVWGR